MGGPPPEPPGRGGGTRAFFFHDQKSRIFFLDLFFRARKGKIIEKPKSRVFENVTKTRFSRFFKGPGATFFL